MTQTFEILGRLPGLNDLIAASKGKGGLYKYNKLKVENEKVITLCVKQHKLKPAKGSAFFTFQWFEKNTRRNPDNIAAGGRKFIFDTLVECGILKNDGWNEIDGWEDYFEVDNKNPRVVVIMMDKEKGIR